jgi:hypothetical protein
LQSADAKPFEESKRLRIFHAFGDPRVDWKGKTLEVAREQVTD